MREHIYTAIILKKQPYSEGDEIITLYTKEAGKIRVLARSSKLAKSKMQHALQVLFLVTATLAHSRSTLSKIIGSEVLDPFIGIRENLTAAAAALYAQELTLKFTADSEENEELFFVIQNFLKVISSSAEERISTLLAKFKIDFLAAAGVAVQSIDDSSAEIFFAPSFGGFSQVSRGIQDEPVKVEVYELFAKLSAGEVVQADEETLNILQSLLSRCIEYQLEREMKAERLLKL